MAGRGNKEEIQAMKPGELARMKRKLDRMVLDISSFIIEGGDMSVESYVKAVKDGLTATRKAKDADGSWIDIPDERMREASMQRWEKMIDRGLAYGIGLPIQRTETINKNVEVSTEDQMKEKMKSAAYRRMLQREIEKAEKEAEVKTVEG